jgi:hypothetical protein
MASISLEMSRRASWRRLHTFMVDGCGGKAVFLLRGGGGLAGIRACKAFWGKAFLLILRGKAFWGKAFLLPFLLLPLLLLLLLLLPLPTGAVSSRLALDARGETDAVVLSSL